MFGFEDMKRWSYQLYNNKKLMLHVQAIELTKDLSLEE